MCMHAHTSGICLKTELDLALFVRMSAGLRSVFINADPAQSVEVGINMRPSTVNDVFHSLLSDKRTQVKHNLQEITLQVSHENISLYIHDINSVHIDLNTLFFLLLKDEPSDPP